MTGTGSPAAEASADSGRSRRRICIVVPTHWAALMGGSQYQAKLLIDHLARSGEYEIHYLAHRTLADYAPENHRIHPVRGARRLRRYTDLVDAWPLYRTLLRIRPSLIYQRSASAYTGIAAHYAKVHGVPMIWHVASDIEVRPFRGPLAPRTLPKFLEKKAIEYGLRHASRVVVQSHQQKRLLEANYGRTDAVLIRNYHPEPLELLRRGDGVRVLWIANLKPIKQPEVFISLAQALRDRADLEFVMIGGRSDNPRWQARLDARLAQCPNVRFLGPLDQDEVNRQLSRSHLLVNTSADEGFSNTFIQAWMRGVPVVSLNVDPDGVFRDERLGYCANGSFPAFMSRVRELAGDPEGLAAASQRVMMESRRTFSMNNVCALCKLIDEVTGRPESSTVPAA